MDILVEAKKLDDFYWENINTKNKAICIDRIAWKMHEAYMEGFNEAKAEAASITQYSLGISGYSDQAREVATVIRSMKSKI